MTATVPRDQLALPDGLGQDLLDVPQGEVAAEDQRHWSVTTIIGVLGANTNALVGWAARETATAAVKHLDTWQSIEQSSGTLEAISWLAGARFRPPKGERRSADLGSAVHELCEQYALTGEKPSTDAELQPYLDRFDEWLNLWQPTYRATEVTVYSPSYGVAGTCDGFLDITDPRDGETLRLIIDYKTSRRSFDKKGKPTSPYSEVALQLAAYRHAELAAVWRPRRFEAYRRRYYLLGPGELEHAVPVPQVDGGGCIHITPDHCELYPVRCDEAVYEAFLYVLEAARWDLQMAHTVIGLPMQRPEPQP